MGRKVHTPAQRAICFIISDYLAMCNFFNANVSGNLSSYKDFLDFRCTSNLNVLLPGLSSSGECQPYPEGISALGYQPALVQTVPSGQALSMSLQETLGGAGRQH